MATTIEDKPNIAERNYYEGLMRKAKANITKAYMNFFGVSESTFYKRLRTREFSPAEKKFFREYVAKQGFNIKEFENEVNAA